MPESTQATVMLECPACHARLRLPATAAGKDGRCPKCAGTIHVPEATGGPSAPTDAPIKFKCEFCSRSLKVPARAAGHRVRCPGCQGEVKVPAAATGAGVATAAAAPPAEAEAGGFGDDLLSGLAGGDSVAPGAEQVAARQATLVPCPSCGAGVSAAATLCTACGYNIRTGKKTRAASTKEGSKVLGAAGAVAKAGGRFAVGVACSAAGALIGAGLWFGIAYLTQREIGYVAWAVGGLAGIGMWAGYQQSSSAGGLVGALMALAGVLMGKFFIFQFIIWPLLEDSMSYQGATPRDRLVDALAVQYTVDAEDNEPEVELGFLAARAEAHEAKRKFARSGTDAEQQAQEEVAKLSDAQVRDKLRAKEDAIHGVMNTLYTPALLATQFKPINLLFFGLALATGWRLGAAGPSFGS